MTLPSVLEKAERDVQGRPCDDIPRDGILVVEFAEVNRVGQGENDGPCVECRHGLDNVLGERVLKRVSRTRAEHGTMPTFNVLRPSSAVGLTWLIMSTKFVSCGPL